uniref:EOG090X0JQ4 n=1 Tax=Daphnia magna TaxID=35525 RepID=A0A4Y7MMD3_9CRUS|nr:EOG090X0JQ4 [Daphnia magna]
MKDLSAIVEQLLVLDREREALHIFIDILRLEIRLWQTQLAHKKEQIKVLKDEKDAADRLAREAKLKAKQAQEDCFRVLRIRHREELPHDLREEFDTLPATIPELDDAIGSANARIQLMGRADEQIVRDYEEREILIQQLTEKIYNLNNRASTMKEKICSVQCFNVHKELPCEKPAVAPPSENLPVEHPPLTYRFPTADTVPVEKLQALAHSDELKECLSNPHVRNILKSLVQSQTPETSITNAMKEPIFLELAHACLKIVEPEKFQHELGKRF